MAVLLTPPYLQFFDDVGTPLAYGKIYTYGAGTTTPKATFTTEVGDIQAPNPIILDAAGRPASGNGSIWAVGSYKIKVESQDGSFVKTTDNITTFNAIPEVANSFFQSFSGTGSQTAFTLSDDLGTDEKTIMVFVNKNLEQNIANGSFTTDTIWIKGAGWTIAAGVATATGAISTSLSQTAIITLVQGQAYSVTYTITASAGSITPSIGGTNGIARNATGTYNEIIIAGSTQTVAFTGAGFTGTLDNVVINVASSAGFDIQNPNVYTLNGVNLTFAVAPPTGTNNIFVFAPSTLVGAASAAADLADASATSAANSAVSAAAFSSARNKWLFSSNTTMANPATGNIRFNNASLASVTAIAISDLSANVGNPDVSPWVLSWDNVAGSSKGTLYIFNNEQNFVFYDIIATSVDNVGWVQLSVAINTSSGTIVNTNPLFIGFTPAGAVTGGISALTGDVVASGSGSVATRVAQITDVNGNEVLKVGAAASAVNEITITNAATGNAPASSATGDDANIAYAINSKGTSGVSINGSILQVAGQCRLVKSGLNLVLQPFNGNNLLIGSKFYTIPSAGVSLAPSGLTASTVYYIYAYMSGATMTLEAATLGYEISTTTGIPVKFGDATRTLVGMGFATGATTWGTGAADVASWYNRRPVALSVGFTVARTTTSTSLVEINSEIRNNFLTWGDYFSQFNGAFRGSTAPSTLSATLNIDGSTNLVGTTFAVTTGTNNMPLSLIASVAATEGRHYTTIFGSISTGTATFVSTADATACGVLLTTIII